ncbi:cytochrome P450 [Nocardiopsis nanhaiensis]
MERAQTEPVPTDTPDHLGTTPQELSDIDLADPDLYREGQPEPRWARLRAHAPVHRNPCRGDRDSFWAVTTHDLVSHVLKSPETFISGEGMRLGTSPAAVEAASGRLLIVSDGRLHAGLRRVVGAAFTPRMVEKLTIGVRRTAKEVVDELLERGTSDLPQVVARLPVTVICDLLGVPESDRSFMLDNTMKAFDGSTPPLEAAEAHADILVYYSTLMEYRRRAPGDDVVSALVHSRVGGRPLTDDEIRLNCDGLISGANETTRHAIVGGVRALMEHPDQWRLLRDRPDLLSGAVEEILRYTSPALHIMRTAAHGTELGGQTIAKGDSVTLWLGAANRDEQVFPSGEQFIVDRTPATRHLAFAHGPHFCVGSTLASLELRAVFQEWINRVGQAAPTSAPVRLRSNLIWGYESLPITLAPT